MQTTVNIGVRALNPIHGLADVGTRWRSAHTSNRELRAAGGKLEEVSPLRQGQFTHGLKQVFYTLAVHIEAMVCLDRVHQS